MMSQIMTVSPGSECFFTVYGEFSEGNLLTLAFASFSYLWLGTSVSHVTCSHTQGVPVLSAEF